MKINFLCFLIPLNVAMKKNIHSRFASVQMSKRSNNQRLSNQETLFHYVIIAVMVLMTCNSHWDILQWRVGLMNNNKSIYCSNHTVSHWSKFTCITTTIHLFSYLAFSCANNNTFTKFLNAIFDTPPINFQSGRLLTRVSY